MGSLIVCDKRDNSQNQIMDIYDVKQSLMENPEEEYREVKEIEQQIAFEFKETTPSKVFRIRTSMIEDLTSLQKSKTGEVSSDRMFTSPGRPGYE